MQDWIVKLNLQIVPGVTEVLGIGGHEKQYHVVVDPNSLLRYEITLEEVIERIKANQIISRTQPRKSNVVDPGTEGGGKAGSSMARTWTVVSSGSLKSAPDFPFSVGSSPQSSWNFMAAVTSSDP